MALNVDGPSDTFMIGNSVSHSGTPTVSVVMSVCNGERYLREAVDSILAQTFADFEFIIINDGSTDGTASILDEYADARIRRITNVSNMGLIASLNLGIAAARGPYIARMDADDVSLPDRFLRQVEYLDSHPDVGVVGTMIDIVDADGTLNCTENWHIDHPTEPDMLRWYLYFHDPISHPTVMMRSDLLDRAATYDIEDWHAEDYGLWLRLIEKTNLVNLDRVLLRYRWHESNVSKVHWLIQRRSTMLLRYQAMRRLDPTIVQHMVESDHALYEETVESDRHWAMSYFPLYKAFSRKYPLAFRMRRRIRAYAGRMIMRHAKRHLRNPSFWNLVLLALYLDPFFLSTALDMYRRRKAMQRLAKRRREELTMQTTARVSEIVAVER